MFTLAHLSDPHLGPLPKPGWRDLIGKRITGYVNWRRKRRFVHDMNVLARIVADMQAQAPSHIAVTGDIANIGLPEEFPPGRAWLESLGKPADVTFVPGNHDIYVREAAPYVERLFGPHMCDDEGLAGFPFVRRRGPVALIALSSGVPTAPFLATGWLGAKQLAELVLVLNQLKKENLFRVVLIHHPPKTDAARHKQLLDAQLFRQLIAAYGADLILHGHDHINMLNWLWGPNDTRVPAVGVPSASARPGAAKDAAGYNLYRIDGTRGAWRCEMISRGITADGTVVETGRELLVG
jgi:3',5'-cyclic AMP phosphodiesterase CpdA